MLKVIQSPAKYLQGPDAAVLFGQYAKNLAESFFVIADDFVMKLAGELAGGRESGEWPAEPRYSLPCGTV